MIKGINNKPFINLSTFVNIQTFINLHPKICRGIAKGWKNSSMGALEVPEGFMNLKYYDNSIVPLFKQYNYLQTLNENDSIKINSNNLNDNELSIYLKYCLGAHDLYSFHTLIDFTEGWRKTDKIIGIKQSAKYFPELMQWISSLIDQNIFRSIGRSMFFIQEAGGISFEHSDPSIDPEYPEIPSEFIHIRPNLLRPFYIRDKQTDHKYYIDTQVAYWNDQDCHGGDPIMEPSYAFRIDGVFTEEFRKKIYE